MRNLSFRIIEALLGSLLGVSLCVIFDLVTHEEALAGFLAYNVGWIHCLLKIKSGKLRRDLSMD
jgi:hypothetical protein